MYDTMDVLNATLTPAEVDATNVESEELPWLRTDEDIWCDIHHEDLYNAYYSMKQYCDTYCYPFLRDFPLYKFMSFAYANRDEHWINRSVSEQTRLRQR